MRRDISPFLVHFTKASGVESAYDVLRRILREKRVLGSSGFVRGGRTCVSFSEAPLRALEHGLINSTGFTRYSPYGLRFEKEWIFSLGGRPVIYGPEHEFAQLSKTQRWRHVRLELGSSTVDFTWEREWRLPCTKLRFSERDVTVVLPDDEARDRFVHDAENDSFHDAWAWTVVLGDVAWALDRGNPWRTVTLRSGELEDSDNGSQPIRSKRSRGAPAARARR
jgi:hypothetical protein